MKYKCSKCELGVIVIPNEEPIRACKCNASVTADMSAHAVGHAGMFGAKNNILDKNNGTKDN